MNPVKHLRAQTGLTQAALAEAAGTSQPTIAAYETSRKAPTIETIERLARSVGLEAHVDYFPPLTREERRSLALHRAIATRIAADPKGVIARARLTLRRMSRVAPDSHALREWRVLLDRPLSALIRLVTDPAPWARELRHVTPFAGVLSAAERARVYRAFAASEERE